MNWNQRRKQQARRRRLQRAGGILLAGLGVVALVGLLLPIEHVRTRRALLDRPPEAVWRILTDLDGMPLWRSDLTSLERLPDLEGKRAWREVGKQGSRIVEISQSEPPRRLVMQGARGGRPWLPIRTFELVSTLGGTLMTVTERAESRNPFARIVVRLNLPGSNVDRFLRDLELRLDPTRRQVSADGGL